MPVCQSMKRTEELIHLSKKIHFEGKVSAFSQGLGPPGGAALVSLLPGAAGQSVRCQPSAPAPLPPGLTPASSTSQIFRWSWARWLVRHERSWWSWHPCPQCPGQAEAVQQGGVPAPLRDCLLLSGGRSESCAGQGCWWAGWNSLLPHQRAPVSPPARLCCQGTLKLRLPRKAEPGQVHLLENQGLGCVPRTVKLL